MCAGGLFGALLGATVMAAAPYVPDQPDVIVAELPLAAARSDLPRLRQQWRADPADLERRLDLADAYLKHAADHGDARGYSLAEGLLADAPPSNAIDQRMAVALRGQHRFTAAGQRLEQMLARGVDDAQVWLDLATLRALTGDYAASARACRPLYVQASRLVATACMAQAHGPLDPARHEQELELALMRYAGRATSEVHGWVLSILAELAQRQAALGRAIGYLEAALNVNAHDRSAILALGHILLEQGRPEAVLDLREQVSVMTADLRVLWAAAMRQLAGQVDFPDLAADVAAARRRGAAGARLAAEYELLVAADPTAAAHAAFTNWTHQKGAADVWLAARAAVAAGNHDQLQTLREWLMASGAQDRRALQLLDGAS